MIRKTLLAAAIACLALQAQAATVVVNVSTDEFEGQLAGQTLTGQLSYDDSTLSSLTDWLPLLSFSFTVNGQSYTLAGDDLSNGAVTFTDGLLTGLDAFNANPATYDFTFSNGFGAPYVFYQNGLDYGYANVSFAAAAAVPEPASYALVLAALGGGLFARRRKA